MRRKIICLLTVVCIMSTVSGCGRTTADPANVENQTTDASSSTEEDTSNNEPGTEISVESNGDSDALYQGFLDGTVPV